ncbi:hypothetical protein, partial [Klebsiella pneumoniae]|uniref:hypothetical protein n=1 Tax=Klebsiella pneumoniae TaxID=573 RepID=UPI0039C08A11
DLGGGGKVVQQLGQGRVALVLGELGAQLVDQQPVLVGVGRLGAGFDGLQQMGQADQGQQLLRDGDADNGVHGHSEKAV